MDVSTGQKAHINPLCRELSLSPDTEVRCYENGPAAPGGERGAICLELALPVLPCLPVLPVAGAPYTIPHPVV